MARTPEVCSEILEHWDLTAVDYLGGGHNAHWLVETDRGSQLVLRRYMADHFEDLQYEFSVMHRLFDLGWPVPTLVEKPIERGRRTWCLLTRLPGSSIESDQSEQRQRGRLLAEFHESSRDLTDLGQRKGFTLPHDLLNDPQLQQALPKLEAAKPDAGYLIRWHVDRALNHQSTVDLDGAETLVLHSDFNSWNILYQDGVLSGIVDFESTHLNYRVADFALSWRGNDDEVIHGYEEVHKLSDLDWQLLVPTFWSWLLLGLAKWVGPATPEELQQASLNWPMANLQRRSPLFGDLSALPPNRL
jgi:aminoglycoside phosphotransferase (APT) family kinase protein